MSQLEFYCGQVRATKGLYHSMALKALRAYMKAIPEVYIIEAINKIGDPIFLRALLEAGVNQRVQDAITTRGEQLL